VLSVLETDRSSGSFNALSSTTLGEWQVPTDRAISGSRILTLSVSPD
jgi:hypothetical protein